MQGVADVKTPEDILHKLQELQKDAVIQSDHLAQAAATLESTQGTLAVRGWLVKNLQSCNANADCAACSHLSGYTSSTVSQGVHIQLPDRDTFFAGQLTHADERLREQQCTVAEADKALQELVASTARLEQRLRMVEKERDGLKRIMKSYQQDSTGDANLQEWKLDSGSRRIKYEQSRIH